MIPDDIRSIRTYALHRADINRRFDPHFHHPQYEFLLERLRKARWAVVPLSDILLDISGGATPRLSDREQYTSHGVRFLRILNVGDGEIVEEDIKYIDDDVHNGLLARSQLAINDVVMTITGRVGNAAVISSKILPSNINQHLVRLRIDTSKCLPEFLCAWLNCPIGLTLTNRPVTGGTRVALDYKSIRRILIPLPKRLSIQEKLVRELNQSRSSYRKKLSQADELLSSLDEYVLGLLGIDSPISNKQSVFAATVLALRENNRANADFFHPERILTLRAIESITQYLSCKALSEIVSFEREQIKTPTENYLGLANVQSDTGELTQLEEDVSGNCFLFRKNDVLFARLRPYLNKVYRAERDGCCSTEFHVLRIMNSEKLSPDYLGVILRSALVLSQTKHMMTGNTHPRLTNEDVIKLVLPIPKMETQRQIASEVRRRQEEARRLKKEADEEWGAAKQRFQEQLLKGTE